MQVELYASITGQMRLLIRSLENQKPGFVRADYVFVLTNDSWTALQLGIASVNSFDGIPIETVAVPGQRLVLTHVKNWQAVRGRAKADTIHR